MKNLKLFIIIAFIVSLLSACSGDAFDNTKLAITLEKKFPNSVVYHIDKHDYEFIVVDSSKNVHYIKMMGKVDDITTDYIVARGK